MASMTEKQIMLTIAISGIVLSGAAFGGVYWASGGIEEENLKIEQLNKKIAEAESKKARIPQDESEVLILRENVAEYVKILPEASDLTDFTRTVNSFSQNSGVVLNHLTPGKAGGGKKSAFAQYVYTMSFSGTVWQFLKFVNMFESYKRFVTVTGFKLSAGRVNGGPNVEDVVHTYTMSVVTYTYNQTAGGKKPVTIVNYDAKKERLREEIYRARQAITIDKYAFRGQRARRDIWVDPRVDNSGDIAGGERSTSLAEQLALIETITADLAATRELDVQAKKTTVLLLKFELQREVKKKLTEIGARIDEASERGMISYRPYLLKFQREVKEPYDQLFAVVFKSDKEKQIGIPMEELVTTRRFMEDALVDGHLEDAVDRFELIREKLRFPPKDERQAVADRLRDLYRKAKVAQDFSRLDLKISGIILLERGLSAAIINGKTFTEGDSIGAALFLKELGSDYTEFLFQGVVLRKKR